MGSIATIQETTTKQKKHYSQIVLAINFQKENKDLTEQYQQSLEFLIKSEAKRQIKRYFLEVPRTPRKRKEPGEISTTTKDTESGIVAKTKS